MIKIIAYLSSVFLLSARAMESDKPSITLPASSYERGDRHFHSFPEPIVNVGRKTNIPTDSLVDSGIPFRRAPIKIEAGRGKTLLSELIDFFSNSIKWGDPNSYPRLLTLLIRHVEGNPDLPPEIISKIFARMDRREIIPFYRHVLEFFSEFDEKRVAREKENTFSFLKDAWADIIITNKDLTRAQIPLTQVVNWPFSKLDYWCNSQNYYADIFADLSCLTTLPFLKLTLEKLKLEGQISSLLNLCSMSVVTGVEVNECELSNDEIIQLLTTLKSNRNLKSLGLAWHDFSVAAVQVLRELLKSNEQLTSLYLAGLGKEEGVFEELFKLFQELPQCQQIKTLKLDGFDLGREGTHRFGQILKDTLLKNTTLRKLHIGENLINREVMLLLAKILRENKSSLSRMMLYCGGIEGEEFTELADALRLNTTLKDLRIDWLQEDDVKGLELLCKGIKENQGLEVLRFLTGPLVLKRGIGAITEIIKCNKTLKKLKMPEEAYRPASWDDLGQEVGYTRFFYPAVEQNKVLSIWTL